MLQNGGGGNNNNRASPYSMTSAVAASLLGGTASGGPVRGGGGSGNRKNQANHQNDRSGSPSTGGPLFHPGQAPTMVMTPHFPPVINGGVAGAGGISDQYTSFLSRIYPQHFTHPFLLAGGPPNATTAMNGGGGGGPASFMGSAYATAAALHQQHPHFWQNQMRSTLHVRHTNFHTNLLPALVQIDSYSITPNEVEKDALPRRIYQAVGSVIIFLPFFRPLLAVRTRRALTRPLPAATASGAAVKASGSNRRPPHRRRRSIGRPDHHPNPSGRPAVDEAGHGEDTR